MRRAVSSGWMHWKISAALTRAAITAGDKAQQTFRREMQQAGQKVLDEVTRTGQYAVVLASRPYLTDTLVNHDLPAMLTGFGVPVLTVDSLPGLDDVPLDASALDIVNNYHARMLESAVIAARNPHLEYIQIVSFGCGHDAYLSDEITRLLREIAGRTPLILKLDESDVQGPLRIRVRSFLETLNMRRAAGLSASQAAIIVSQCAQKQKMPFDRASQTVKKPFREVWRAEVLQIQSESGDMCGGFGPCRARLPCAVSRPGAPQGREGNGVNIRKRTPQADFSDTLQNPCCARVPCAVSRPGDP